MEKVGKFLFLGTGGSLGIPVIGCHCPVCRSSSPFNKRLRPSGLIKIGGKQLLIDAGPDVRMQCLRYGIERLDGVLLTHAHFDHLYGIDDLRIFYFLQKGSLPSLVSKETFAEITTRFQYLLRPVRGGAPQLIFQQIEGDVGRCDFMGVSLTYLSFWQMGMKVNGYRIADFAYVCDIREYSPEIFSLLKGVKVLVLSALRHEPSPAHFSLGEAQAFARQVGAEMTWLTHVAHDLDHETVNSQLPQEVQLAYDGQEIEFIYGS